MPKDTNIYNTTDAQSSIWPSQILTSSLWRRTLRQPAVCLATANRSLQVLATTGKFHWSHMVNGNTSNCIWELSSLLVLLSSKPPSNAMRRMVSLVRLAVNIPLNAKLLEICILALNIYKFLWAQSLQVECSLVMVASLQVKLKVLNYKHLSIYNASNRPNHLQLG